MLLSIKMSKERFKLNDCSFVSDATAAVVDAVAAAVVAAAAVVVAVDAVVAAAADAEARPRPAKQQMFFTLNQSCEDL